MRNLLFILLLAILSAGCTEYHVIKANGSFVETAQHEIPDFQLLDIGVSIFDHGVPNNEKRSEEEQVFPDVRKAEAYYIPFQLRRILEETGQWGAVRTMPVNAIGADVIVAGKIISSDGEVLAANITVLDATGRLWFNREYTERASKFAYRDGKLANMDPFQNLYYAVANDILNAKRALLADDLSAIRKVAELRFAKDFAPQAFAQYVNKNDNGDLVIDRLPATDDPMMERVRLVKNSNDLIIDTFDQHYLNFYRKIKKPYRNWRKSSYDEVTALRKIKRSSKNRVVMGGIAVVGGIAAVIGGGGAAINALGHVSSLSGAKAFRNAMSDDKPGQIHIDALRELSQSFEAEVAPQIVDVKGKTIMLTGSVQKQYDSWRKMLRDFYIAQTGFSQGAIDIDNADAPEGW